MAAILKIRVAFLTVSIFLNLKNQIFLLKTKIIVTDKI